jgi:hypothetical protein
MPEEREGPPLHLIEGRLIERSATPSVVMAGLVPAIQIGPTPGNYGTTKDTKFKKSGEAAANKSSYLSADYADFRRFSPSALRS